MRGVSIPELLVALALTLVIASGIARAIVDARSIFTAQPEAADLLQRGRTALAWLVDDFAVAGAGPYRRADDGPLLRWVPPIHPRRLGPLHADPEAAAFSDRVTLIAVPDGAPQTTVEMMASPADPVPLALGPGCPPGDQTCGFEAEQQAIVFDATTAFQPFRIAATAARTLFPEAPLARAYLASHGARVVNARVVSSYHDAVRRQLRRSDGDRSDVPVADDVVGLELRYYGWPFPPDRPRPPPGLDNCVVDREGLVRLPVLAPTHATLVELTPALLSDGPWCGVGPFRFDADLYRVRRVRIEMRLQAGSAAVRGRDATRFTNPGTLREHGAAVPDLVLSADVSPANLRSP